jgi:hypothetical protein
MRGTGWWITVVCIWIALTAAAVGAWLGLGWISTAPYHDHHFAGSLSWLTRAVSLALVVVLAWLGLPFLRASVSRLRVASDIFGQSSDR